MKAAIAWDEIDGRFIMLDTERDIKACVDAEWPVARWNAELAIYEGCFLHDVWQEVEVVEFAE